MARIVKKEKIKSDKKPRVSKSKLKSEDELNDFAENIVNTVREPLLVLDKDLRVIKASRSFYDFFKVTPDVTIGNLIYDLGNNQWDIPKLRELLETILPEKTTFDNYEVEHKFSTIGKRVMLLNARQIERAARKEKIILLAIEDVTERKLLEVSLSEKNRMTHEYLDILFNRSHVPIIIWDSSLVITHLNHAFEGLLGYSWNEVKDEKIDFLFPADKVDSTIELIKNTLLDEKTEIIEIEILTKDKEIKTILWSSTNIFDKKGKRIVATIAQDITKRKRTEDALNIFETRYRCLFESAKDGILILDAETGKIIDANPFLIYLSGSPKEELVGKPIWEIGFFKHIAADKERFLELQHKEYVRYDNLLMETETGQKIYVEFVSNVYMVDHLRVIQCNIRDITERNRTEKELRESEEKFRTITDNSPDAIFIADNQGRYLYVNAKAIQMLGYSKEEMMTFTIENISPKVKVGEYLQILQILLQDGSVFRELDLVKKDGSLIPTDFNAVLLPNGFIYASCRDITERKDIQSKIKFKSDLLSNIGQAVIATDLLGIIIYWNNAAEKIYGWTSNEALGQSIVDLTPVEQTHEQANKIMEELSKGNSWSGEFLVKRKDGSSFPAYVTDAPIHDSGGKLIGIIGMSIDITERKRAEEEIIMLAHSLKSINECVCITDLKNKILFVNKSFLETYGYSDNELLGENINLVRSLNNPPGLIKDILPSTINGEWQGELWNKRKDRSEFLISLSTTIIKDKEGNSIGLIGVATDITKRNNDEKELILATERAQESDKLKTEFLAQMSHEIRTPLNAVLGNVEFLDDMYNDRIDAETKDCFDSIDIASKRIIRTIDLILNAAELQTSGYKPYFIKIDLDSEILKKLYREHLRYAGLKGLELIYKCETNETKILADEYSITQIFANLIDNAIRYTKKGKVEILLSKNETGNIVVAVKDTGIGINTIFLPKLFEPFAQEEQGYSRSFEGSGLGLALVKSYCHLNNLLLEVESEKNTGSTFRIIFNNI